MFQTAEDSNDVYGPALRHVLVGRSTRFGAESRAKREKKIAAALVFSALGRTGISKIISLGDSQVST